MLRLIPGLENARFLRYGQIHRNTYICAPVLLDETLRLKKEPRLLFAGQLSGVEGYTESIATGLLAGIYAASLARGEEPIPAPRSSALGSARSRAAQEGARQERTPSSPMRALARSLRCVVGGVRNAQMIAGWR